MPPKSPAPPYPSPILGREQMVSPKVGGQGGQNQEIQGKE